jgi:hypothetical protein
MAVLILVLTPILNGRANGHSRLNSRYDLNSSFICSD